MSSASFHCTSAPAEARPVSSLSSPQPWTTVSSKAVSSRRWKVRAMGTPATVTPMDTAVTRQRHPQHQPGSAQQRKPSSMCTT